MNNKFPAECKFRDGSGKLPPRTSLPGYQPINCFFRYLFRLLFFVLAILVLFTSLSLPSNLQAAEKKTPEQGRTGNGESVRLKYEKLNLDKEMRRAVESLLPEGSRIVEFQRYGDGCSVTIAVPKGNSRQHLVYILDFMDKLEDSDYSSFFCIYSGGILGNWYDKKQHRIYLALHCAIKTGKEHKEHKEPDIKMIREKSANFYDNIREIFLLKPANMEIRDMNVYMGDGKSNFSFRFVSYPNQKYSNPLQSIAIFIVVLSKSKYAINPKILQREDIWVEREGYWAGIHYGIPTYTSSFSPSERQKYFAFVKKIISPVLTLKKIRFNKASKGLIIEISPQSKDKAAILKSIIAFLKEFAKLKGMEELFFDRLVIHLSKDKTGSERMFIEMRHYGEFLPPGTDKPVYPGSKEYKKCRESRIIDLEKTTGKYPEKVFSNGYTHSDNGKYVIFTIEVE